MRYELVYELDRLLKARRGPLPREEICERLEISPAHFKRLLRFMREYLQAPIFNVRRRGYRYDPTVAFELPGVWFSPEELHALLLIEQLAGGLPDGVFGAGLARIRKRARAMLEAYLGADQAARVRVLSTGRRGQALPAFAPAVRALRERRRLRLAYHSRSKGERTAREVSPQRLVHYRGNWYLDAWCHRAEALRSFALERIEAVEPLDACCHECSEAMLDRHLATGFGIFGGEPDKLARIRFTEKAARWVRDEEWHPHQQMRELPDGGIELAIPYANPTELIMEIARWGPEAEALAPASLRRAMADWHERAARRHGE
ncbi:MAG: WYL domain-containing protein [Mariprofundaceae bacterium]